MSGRLSALLILLAAVLTAACGSNNGNTTAASTTTASMALAASAPAASASATTLSKSAINVAAASDLRGALTSMQPAIESACNTKLTFIFGSSGTLKEQILAGADYNLFMSADTAYIDELDRAGELVPGGRATYGVGRLALVWRSGLPPLRDVADLSRPDIKQISIANPAHAPYGRAAQQAMAAAQIGDTVQGRLVFGENIRQATDYVEQGNADAGLVALALVIGTRDSFIVVDAALHQPIVQAGGVIRGTNGTRASACTLEYVRSAAGQATLKQFGFEPGTP